MTVDLQVINQRHNPQVEEFVFEKMQHVMDRFDRRVNAIQLHVHDDEGLGRHHEKSCSIDAKVPGAAPVHVSAHDPNVYSAVQKAIERLEAVLVKRVEKKAHATVRHQMAREQTADKDIPEAV